MSTWYSDINQFVVRWLRNLIEAGHLPKGLVEDKSIHEIQAQELSPYTQAHFFAGIGGWPLALQISGWPADQAVWTGSCPCQPFSVAGQRKGAADERHLWPEWFRLIEECRPPVIFGEQVASRDGYAWFDLVQANLEGLGYACGMVVSPAAGYGAPHIRHRIYFVADAQSQQARFSRQPRTLGDASSEGRQQKHRSSSSHEETTREQKSHYEPTSPSETNGPWADVEWLSCSDGRARPTQPGLSPLAYGISGRLGRLRAYGNAIVVPQAIEFIKAYMAQEEQDK